MKKKEKKVLKEKLLTAIKRVLKTNNASLTNKIEKILKKSIKKIADKTDIRKIVASTKKTKKSV